MMKQSDGSDGRNPSGGRPLLNCHSSSSSSSGSSGCHKNTRTELHTAPKKQKTKNAVPDHDANNPCEQDNERYLRTGKEEMDPILIFSILGIIQVWNYPVTCFI